MSFMKSAPRISDMEFKKTAFSFVILSIALLSTSVASANPQSKCVYIKSTGFVDCRNRNLSSVPILPADTRVLDLSNNKIQRLDQGSFNTSLLVNEIYLSNNSIKYIHYGTFQNLNFLKVLDLSDNQLQNVFADMPVSLEALYLDRNPLSHDYILQQRLQYLRFLSLDGVNFTKIPSFSQILPVLKYLDLNNNPALKIDEADLKSFRELKTLSISPRVFGGRARSQECRKFVNFAKQRNIEVKNLVCHNDKNFEFENRQFQRTYENEDTWYDRPDNILNWNVPNANLFDLQTLVSDGFTNFFKSLIQEKIESEASVGKVKDPLRMDDYVVRNPELALRNVYLSGFPLLKTSKEPSITFSSADAEELKRFKVTYLTAEDGKPMTISGIFNFYMKVFRFTCEFSEAVFNSERNMLRLYDLRVKPIRTEEKLNFDTFKCNLNDSDRIATDVLSDMAMKALSQYWLDHAINLAGVAVVDTQVRSVTKGFADMYKQRVLRTLIDQGIGYLRSLNINSFDVSPSSIGPLKENTLDVNFNYQLYNIKIFNLFNYSDYNAAYSVTNEGAESMKVLVTSTVYYPQDNTALLAITSKDDPRDVMTIFVTGIEIKSVFDVKTINKVRKLKLLDVNVRIIDTDEQKHVFFVITLMKKYLSLELSNEFRRALTFLISKIDFYSLNAL